MLTVWLTPEKETPVYLEQIQYMLSDRVRVGSFGLLEPCACVIFCSPRKLSGGPAFENDISRRFNATLHHAHKWCRLVGSSSQDAAETCEVAGGLNRSWHEQEVRVPLEEERLGAVGRAILVLSVTDYI